ncbi:hypothetical protein L1887_43373 [Cichorium endivia]|nr:hypothetical protein L1887_43373 [Cichorium endivia]
MPDSAGRAAVAAARRASEQQRAGHAAEADAGGDPAGAQRRVYAASRPPAGLAGQPRQRARSARGAAVVGAAAKQRFAQRGQRPDGRRRAKGLGRLALAQNGQKLRLMDGWLVTQDEAGNYWYLLHGELTGSSFDMQQTHRLVTTLNALQERLKARYPAGAAAFARDRVLQRLRQPAGQTRCFDAGHRHPAWRFPAHRGGVPLTAPAAAERALDCHRRAGGYGGDAAALWRTAPDDAGDEHEHHRYFSRLHALLPDRTDGARRGAFPLAKPGQSTQCAAAGAADDRRRLPDYDAGPLPRDPPDGGICRRGAERLLPDGDFLASVAVPGFTGAPGSADGYYAALAGRVAAQ